MAARAAAWASAPVVDASIEKSLGCRQAHSSAAATTAGDAAFARRSFSLPAEARAAAVVGVACGGGDASSLIGTGVSATAEVEAAAAAAGGGAAAGGEVAAPAPCDVCGGVLSCEMLHHAFDSLTIEVRATLHLELQSDRGGDGHTLDVALAAAEAYGAALSRAIRVDPRRRGAVASSKGTLSK